ncbi:hypothetical protein ACHAW6_009426 [Cyclotella cf. meneghiniana]
MSIQYADTTTETSRPCAQKHVLDNKVLEVMKNHIWDDLKFTVELVPPGCHWKNAAKVVIHNFKSHFLSVLAGTSNNFLPNVWDCLLLQTKITLNLLHQSNATPTISAHAHSLPWDEKLRSMKKLTHEAHGRITVWTVGISTHRQNITKYTTATSKTLKQSVSQAPFNLNTRASQTPHFLIQTNS